MTAIAYDGDAVSRLVEAQGTRPEMLVQILHDIVALFGYVPEQAVRQLAEELNLSRADVHGVVSYYHDFRTSKPGKHCRLTASMPAGLMSVMYPTSQ